MKILNRKAAEMFLQLSDGLDNVRDHRTIDNSSFMAVHIEVVAKRNDELIISIAHYFNQKSVDVKYPRTTILKRK